MLVTNYLIYKTCQYRITIDLKTKAVYILKVSYY